MKYTSRAVCVAVQYHKEVDVVLNLCMREGSGTEFGAVSK